MAQPLIQQGLRNAFAVKWDDEFDHARPEEVVQGLLKGDGHSDLVDNIIGTMVDERAITKDAAAFTTYAEGCPLHRTYVAGHGTFAGVVFALAVVKYGLKSTDKAYEELAQTLISFSNSRSVAGVHFLQDNVEGFRLGALTVARSIKDLALSQGLKDSWAKKLQTAANRAAKLDWLT